MTKVEISQNALGYLQSAITAERERLAKLVEQFDNFEYREVRGAGSVVAERESMRKLAKEIREASDE